MKWTEEEKEYLRNNYGKLPITEVEEHLGRKRTAINQYARVHNISSNRYYTKEEEQYIEENFGILSGPAIAKHLGRDYKTSVRLKISKMGLGRMTHNTCDLNISEVSRLLGVDRKTMIRHKQLKRIKSRKRGRYVMIREEELLRFMQQYPNYWNATKCEQWYFDQHDWFHAKLLEDRAKKFDRKVV